MVILVDFGQFMPIITAFHKMQAGIICFIINSIIMERHKDSLVYGIFQGYLIWHVIVAEFIYIFPIHPFRGCRKPKHKLRLKVIHNPPVLPSDCMVELVYYKIIKIILCKIFFVQIVFPSQCFNRSKYHGFPCVLLLSIKEAIIL